MATKKVSDKIFTEDELDLQRVVTEYKSLYENHMWKRWAKAYRDYLLDGSSRATEILDFQSNMKVPIVKQYVDALWTSIYDNNLNFKTTGRNKNSHKKASSAHDYLSWAFTRSKSWQKIMDSSKEAILEWNGYIKVWFTDNSKSHSFKKITKDKKTGELKTKVHEWDEVEMFPDMSYVSIFNLFHPMYIDNLNESPVVIERAIIHKSSIESRFKNLGYDEARYKEALENPRHLFSYDFDKIKMSAFWDRKTMNKDLDEYCKKSNISKLTDDNFFDVLMNNYLHVKYDGWFCEVIEYWEGEEFKLMVNGFVIFSWANPLPDKRHPYVWLLFNKIPWIPYGRWIWISLSDIQDVADQMMNLAIDNQKFLIAPMFERMKWWDIFSESDWVIEWSPFKTIETNQKWAITRLDVGNPQMVWLSWWVDFLFQLWEMSEWINSYAMWYQNKVERSATWVSALVQSFKSRMLPLIDSLNQALNIIAKKWLLYWIVNFDDSIEIEKFTDGKSIIKAISIEDLMWEYSIEFNAQSLKTASRELKRESLLNLLNAILPFAQMLKESNATKFKADDFLKDIFDTYELNPEKYFTATTNEFIKDEINSERAKMKISKKLQEGVLTEEQINPPTPSEIFAGNAKQEQIAKESAEAKEWTEDLKATPWIDETVVKPMSEIY